MVRRKSSWQVKPEEGLANSNLIAIGQEIGTTGDWDRCAIDLNRVIRGEALDHPAPLLEGHLRMERLDGRMVQGNMMGWLSKFPTQRDLLFP
ncbi:MAG: hypothetical protein ABIF09_10225, partial [Gemmatimonadota bacterium]